MYYGRSKWAKFPLVILLVAVGITVFGYVVMSLWNALIPDLFHGPVLGFWQAVGLLVLAKILLGGGHRGHKGHGGHWRHRFAEKWEKMSPEERERMRAEWSKRCGGWWDEPQKKEGE
jgi:hypothetical protein